MKKCVYSLALLIALTVPVLAGDIQEPGKIPPPPPPVPCTENCTNSATTNTDPASGNNSTTLIETIIDLLGLIVIP